MTAFGNIPRGSFRQILGRGSFLLWNTERQPPRISICADPLKYYCEHLFVGRKVEKKVGYYQSF